MHLPDTNPTVKINQLQVGIGNCRNLNVTAVPLVGHATNKLAELQQQTTNAERPAQSPQNSEFISSKVTDVKISPELKRRQKINSLAIQLRMKMVEAKEHVTLEKLVSEVLRTEKVGKYADLMIGKHYEVVIQMISLHLF